MKRGPKGATWNAAKMAAAYRAGESAQIIADRFEVTRHAVYYHLRKLGVPLASRGKPRIPQAKRTAALALRQAGLTHREVTAQLGVTRYLTTQAQREAGWQHPLSTIPMIRARENTARLTRRCDCGGLIRQGVAHNCQRSA